MSKNIREININQIKIHDPFWSAMQHRMTDTVIPFQDQTDEGDDGPAQESENGMAVLFSLLLRFAGLTDPPVLLPERTITVESPSFIV